MQNGIFILAEAILREFNGLVNDPKQISCNVSDSEGDSNTPELQRLLLRAGKPFIDICKELLFAQTSQQIILLSLPDSVWEKYRKEWSEDLASSTSNRITECSETWLIEASDID